jgi:NitT/TauT family transport system ATP-binding protein
VTALPPAGLALRGIGMEFHGSDGRNHVLEGIDLDVPAGEVLAIVGRSGCGKTTLLRIMAGLERPTRGDVHLDGRPLTGPEPRVGLVFQQYAATLLPWKRALDNVLFGLRVDRGDRAAWRERALALMARMGLDDCAGRYPWELSGGMQQRVALARALIRTPRVLLLDEPFASVDEGTRADLQALIRALHRSESCSIVLVTHNLDEVLHLSRRVVILGGRPARVERILDTARGLTREALRSHLTVAGGAA